MNALNIIAASLLIFGMGACGASEQPKTAATPENDASSSISDASSMEHGNHADHNMTEKMDGIGHTTGTIRSVGAQGNFLTIDHGPFKGGIDMGAMTMGFDIMGDVDLSTFSDGDEVAFMVKQGRDGSYRIMSICNTGTDGADCLDEIMDH